MVTLDTAISAVRSCNILKLLFGDDLAKDGLKTWSNPFKLGGELGKLGERVGADNGMPYVRILQQPVTPYLQPREFNILTGVVV